METYESLRKTRDARLKRFADKHVTSRFGGQEDGLGMLMSLEGMLDNSDSDIQVIKELEGRVTDYMRLCDVLPGQVQDLD